MCAAWARAAGRWRTSRKSRVRCASGRRAPGPSPGRPATVGEEANRRSRTPTSCSATCRRICWAGRCGWIPTPRPRRSIASAGNSAWTCIRPRRASSTSSTRTCTARCGWCRCSAVTTRATSHWPRSAGLGRCTPTRSPSSSAPFRSSCRAPPAFCAPRATCAATTARSFRAPSSAPLTGSQPRK